jgi:hypothetical protein
VSVFTTDREKRTVERLPDKLTRENWTEYVGKDK